MSAIPSHSFLGSGEGSFKVMRGTLKKDEERVLTFHLCTPTKPFALVEVGGAGFGFHLEGTTAFDIKNTCKPALKCWCLTEKKLKKKKSNTPFKNNKLLNPQQLGRNLLQLCLFTKDSRVMGCVIHRSSHWNGFKGN